MEENYKKLDIYKFWQESELHSQKGNTFFEIYDELFSKYRGKNITFVEIGVKWGGSLLMWKKYFVFTQWPDRRLSEATVASEYLV